MDPKFCVNCKHFAVRKRWTTASMLAPADVCAHPNLIYKSKPDLVSGEVEITYPLAREMRYTTASRRCGEDGKLWEEKPKPEPPKIDPGSLVIQRNPPIPKHESFLVRLCKSLFSRQK